VRRDAPVALLLAAALAARAAAAPAPGRVIVLDPGHGGYDWGATNKQGQLEKDLCLVMARKVKALLEKETGAKVLLTRDSDTFLRLDERVRASVDLDADVFVSLHANQTRNKKAQGMTVYSFGGRGTAARRRRRRSGLPQLPPPPKVQSEESAALAGALVADLRSAGLRVDPIARAHYYVLKNPEAPSVLVEMGYLSNADEARQLADPAYQDRVASTLSHSLAGYLARVSTAPADELTALKTK